MKMCTMPQLLGARLEGEWITRVFGRPSMQAHAMHIQNIVRMLTTVSGTPGLHVDYTLFS